MIINQMKDRLIYKVLIIFLENKSIGKIAKEITEEMDIENMADGDISQLFNPENMSKIFQVLIQN